MIEKPIDKPKSPPPLDPLKLVTMTIDVNINRCLNLKVIAEHIKIDHQITGVKYLSIKKGDYEQDEKEGRFKNQCTFNINVGEKKINTKLFNNGKMVNVGCTDILHAHRATEILLQRIHNMNGVISYEIPLTFSGKRLKKFFKDDIRKKFGDLCQLLVYYLELDMDIEPFNPEYTADESYNVFLDILNQDPSYSEEIMYLNTVISVLKCYYDETELLDRFGDPEFQYLLAIISNNSYRSNTQNGYITYELPSYLNNHEQITYQQDKLSIVLINESTNCGFFINRESLRDILEDMIVDDNDTVNTVKSCTYNKSNYPGVIIEYRTPTNNQQPNKVIKIIIFNTGKINITSARTHQQVVHGYNFIQSICHKFFHKLILSSEYDNRKREYESSLPDQHYIGTINGQQYYLLNKRKITSHPRNTRLLHMHGKLSHYLTK